MIYDFMMVSYFRRTIMNILSTNLIKVCMASALLVTSLGTAQADEHKDMKGSESLMHSMKDGMKKMDGMKATGDVDKDFAMMMKMHHQQALDMAQIEIDQGKSAEMKAMAKKIMAAQKKEISEFDSWLSKQK